MGVTFPDKKVTKLTVQNYHHYERMGERQLSRKKRCVTLEWPLRKKQCFTERTCDSTRTIGGGAGCMSSSVFSNLFTDACLMRLFPSRVI